MVVPLGISIVRGSSFVKKICLLNSRENVWVPKLYQDQKLENQNPRESSFFLNLPHICMLERKEVSCLRSVNIQESGSTYICRIAIFALGGRLSTS